MSYLQKRPSHADITCQQLNKQITAYLRRGLPLAQQEAMAQHLLSCPACSQKIQEAKNLESELVSEAALNQPKLSQDASLRIQEEVYNRMRRTLLIQRTLNVLHLSGVIVMALAVFGGILFFSNQWLQFLANPSIDTVGAPSVESVANPPINSQDNDLETTTVSGEATTLELPLERDGPDQMPSVAGTLPAPAPSLISITPSMLPQAIAATIMKAASEGDIVTLDSLFVGMRASRGPTLRLWKLFTTRCQNVELFSTIRYESFPRDATLIARVDMYQGNNFIGELKMRRIDGEWFTVFASYPTLKGCHSNSINER